MGLFSKSQEQKDKEALDSKIAEAGGIAKAVAESDYQKLILSQNECVIGLLTVIASEGNVLGQAATTVHIAQYYEAKKKLLK